MNAVQFISMPMQVPMPSKTIEKVNASLRSILPEGIGRCGLLMLSICISQKSLSALPADNNNKAAIATTKILVRGKRLIRGDSEPAANKAPKKTEMKAISPFTGRDNSMKERILRIGRLCNFIFFRNQHGRYFSSFLRC